MSPGYTDTKVRVEVRVRDTKVRARVRDTKVRARVRVVTPR